MWLQQRNAVASVKSEKAVDQYKKKIHEEINKADWIKVNQDAPVVLTGLHWHAKTVSHDKVLS